MKRATLLIILVSAFSGAFAQTAVYDSVSMGAGYTDDVYYSFADGEVKTVPADNWQIAFSVMPTNFPTNTLQGTTIRVNGGRGYIVKRVPNQKIADFNSFTDTTGLHSWGENVDSDSAWDVGAFNKGWVINQTTANYGWGSYNQFTKAVETDSSLWVIYKEDGSWIKKLYIEQQEYDTLYTFTFANMDNSSTVNAEVNKKDYTKRNFVYYDLENDVIRDREPDNDSWDIVFTKYRAMVQFGPGPMVPYGVTGVLHNIGVKTEQVDNVKVGEADTTLANFDSRIATIGWDWKSFNSQTFSYDIQDSQTFFIMAKNTQVYSCVFTKFEGSATGKVVFFLGHFVSTNDINLVSNYNVYPNPTSGAVNISVTAEANLDGTVLITDMTGRVVANQAINAAQGQTVNTKMDVSALNSGMYFVTVNVGEYTTTKKLIVR